MSNFAPSRTPKKGVCEWRIVSLATKTFWWNFTCCYFTIFFKFNFDLITLNWAEYLCRGIFTCRNLTIFFSNKYFRLNLDLILFRIELNLKFEFEILKKKSWNNRRYLTKNLGTNTKSGCSSSGDDTAQVQVLSVCSAYARAAAQWPLWQSGRLWQALQQQSRQFTTRVFKVRI